MLVRRIITGLLVGAVWTAVLLFLPPWCLLLILCAVSCLCQNEFYGMLRNGRTKLPSSPAWGMAIGCAWLVYCFLFPPASCGFPYGNWLIAAMVFAFMMRMLFMRREHPAEYAAVTLLGCVYLPFMLGFFIRIAQWGTTGIGQILPDRTGVFLAFYVAAVVKFSDVGGFAFGVPFGRHKLAPSVSPKKSWEGLCGSILLGVAVSVSLVWLSQHCKWIPGGPLERLPLWWAPVLGVVLALVGLLGDLTESRFKREAEIKDSATLLPGLGGFLDMFDSLVFAPAVMYFFLKWFEGN